MTIDSISSNGTAGPPPQKQQHRTKLAFLDVDQNSYHRNSTNTSWTYRESDGPSDLAVALLNDSINACRQRRPKETIDLERLDLRTLLSHVEQRVQGIPELLESTNDLPRSQQLLRELSARRQTKTVRLTREIAGACVGEVAAPLRLALRSAFQEAPFDFPELADGFDRSLRDLSIPSADFTPVKRFHHALRAMDSLAQVNSIPPKMREGLLASLRKRCEAEREGALKATLQEYVGEALREALDKFLAYTGELRTAQASFRRNVEAARSHLERRRTIASQRSVHSRSSVLLELDTPSDQQLLAGIRDRHQCGDRMALTQLFDEHLSLALTEIARARHPHVSRPATLTDLLAQLPPREIALAASDVVAGLIGDIHTVYTAVRGFGVVRAAQELYERAAPLCHLESRDHVRLHVETHRDVIVRMPDPRGPDDAEIAEQLREQFRRLHATCQFLDDPLETEITVVRTLVGFPIGLEAGNLPLLIDYAQSAEQGHRPHLFGFLPDAPDGKPLPRLLALARYHQQHH